MKRLICAVAVVMACLVVVGGALANTYTDHVNTAPIGKGDLLIYPVYLASEGIETKLTVINTSENMSVVAKVVVRSAVYSQEVLDFMIYLSPTDMWIGTLKYGVLPLPNTDVTKKGVFLYSSDLSGPTELNPGKELAPVDCINDTEEPLNNDTNQWGYVEIIEAWSASLGLPPVAKATIKTAYDKIPKTALLTQADTVNSLAGSYMISVPAVDWEASADAFVLRDYDNQQVINTGELTIIGQKAWNNVQEVEAAINRNAFALTFNSSAATGGSLHVFTFPTKISDHANCARTSTSGSRFFPPNGEAQFGTMRIFNNEEKSSEVFSPQLLTDVFDEVNFKAVPAGIFDFGWVLYTFGNGMISGTNLIGLPLDYDGAPVIPTVIEFNKGVSIRSGAATEGKTFGLLGRELAGYQYTYSTSFVTTGASN